MPLAGILLTLLGAYLFSGHELRVKKLEFDAACASRISAIHRELVTNLRLLHAVKAFAAGTERDLPDLRRFVSGFGESADLVRFYSWQPLSIPPAQPLDIYAPASQAAVLDPTVIGPALAASTRMDGPVSFLAADGFLVTVSAVHPSAGDGVLSRSHFQYIFAGEPRLVKPVGIDIWIDEISGPRPIPVQFFKSHRPERPRPLIAIFQPDPAQWEHQSAIELAGLKWRIRCRPIAYFLDVHDLAPHLCILLTGFLATLLLSLFAESQLREAARVRRLVRRRTRQLVTTRDRLKFESLERQHAESRFRRAFTDSSVGMAIFDSANNFLAANPAACELLGYTEEELIGRSVGILTPDVDHDPGLARLASVALGQLSSYVIERSVLRKDGTSKWIRGSISRTDNPAQDSQLIVIFEDVTDRIEARRQLLFEASHDALTSLPNRRSFDESLAAAIRDADDHPVALLYLDLDGFKSINDSLSHSMGDKLLRHVATRLADCTGNCGVTSRVGGDEFTVVLPLTQGRHRAAVLATDIIQAIQQPFFIEGQELCLNASIGIGIFPDDAPDKEALLQCADAAMYEAKRRGKGGFRFYTAEIRAQALERIKLESALRHALDRHEFSLVYQPIFSARDRRLIRFEALCRWSSAELGPVAPDQFIPVAEETGIIVSLGRWVLEQACAQAVLWNESNPDPVQVAVNVSSIQFARPDFVGDVAAVLARTRLQPQLLEIELTESVVARDLGETVRKMRQLRQMGITIALDDFGTGYSSLSYLQRLPLDSLKIDRSFVGDMTDNEDSLRMVGSIIGLAHGLGLRVVSEGVENENQAAALRDFECDEFQGYLLARPESAEAATRRLVAQFEIA